MSITFKAFAAMLAEGKQTYSNEGSWKEDAEEAGFKVKKLSGEVADGDQTWGAFDEHDKKVGEFTEAEEGGWLMLEGRVDELFGIFRNNEKKAAEREQLKKDTAKMVDDHRKRQELKRQQQAQKNGRGEGEDVDPEDDEEDDKKKKTTSQTRSASTRGTRTTQSAAQGRAAERDWVNNM